jgi:hypothetical protein
MKTLSFPKVRWMLTATIRQAGRILTNFWLFGKGSGPLGSEESTGSSQSPAKIATETFQFCDRRPNVSVSTGLLHRRLFRF